jgi:hypothetical protein
VRVSSLFVVLAFLASLFTASPAFAQAQSAESKYWGVGFSFTPKWTASMFFQELMITEGEPPLEGDEFSFGVVRGSKLGGDWGVSYIRQRIKNGSTTVNTESDSGTGYSFQGTNTQVFENVYWEGVEVHVFVPVATFKSRVQVGFNVGGGVGVPRGTIHETVDATFTNIPPVGPPQTTVTHEERSDPAEEVLLKIQPLAKVEAQGAFIVAQGLKVKVSVGMNMPSAVSFRIGAIYLIGAK